MGQLLTGDTNKNALNMRTPRSDANEAFLEVCYLRYFPFPTQREALFS
jgi:hypothetical protein